MSYDKRYAKGILRKHCSRFVYTDELTLTNENVLPLYSLADKYAVLSLRLKTVDYFKAMLVPSDALAVLTAVSCYPELREMYA